jgi:preprotein translocase subunit SecE
MVIAVVGVAVLSDTLGGLLPRSGYRVYLQYGIPTGIVGGMALLMFHIVNRQKSADFLIATEGEMKKVSWSSRREVIGSTKVVIIVTLIMAGLLYSVDFIFVKFFAWTGVMGG